MLDCTPSVPSEVTFTFNDQPLPNAVNPLVIDPAAINNTGLYTCYAFEGTVTSQVIDVIVLPGE